MKKLCFALATSLVGLLGSGCFFFGSKGVFDKSSYEIVKLEVDDKVVLSPQELASWARGQLGIVGEQAARVSAQSSLENNILMHQYGGGRLVPRSDLNTAFDQLMLANRGEEDEEASAATPLQELANITLKSTFNLDKTQEMMYGKVGCNDYTAKFFWQDSTKIVVSGGASTRKLCYPKEVTSFQSYFVRYLDGVYTVTKLKNRKGYVLNNGRMRIYVR